MLNTKLRGAHKIFSFQVATTRWFYFFKLLKEKRYEKNVMIIYLQVMNEYCADLLVFVLNVVL